MSTAEAMPSAEELKLCCASAYQRDAVALILGDSYHPGGLDLTRRLARSLGLRPGDRVLDVASGPGTTAFLLASEFGVEVDGVDLGDITVAKANATAASGVIVGRVRFHLGDAERIPLPDGSVDAVVCECAFCTFPDKQTAAAEMARVLKPGGRVGITDVALELTRLDAELQSLAGWVSCLADARPVQQYVEILAGAGLTVTHTESHDDALAHGRADRRPVGRVPHGEAARPGRRRLLPGARAHCAGGTRRSRRHRRLLVAGRREAVARGDRRDPCPRAGARGRQRRQRRAEDGGDAGRRRRAAVCGRRDGRWVDPVRHTCRPPASARTSCA
jgi:arsenite methyltransferase